MMFAFRFAFLLVHSNFDNLCDKIRGDTYGCLLQLGL